MKKVIGINLRALRHAEFLQFIKNVLAIILTYDPAVLKVLVQYNALNGIKDTLDDLFATDTGSDITDELLQLDNARDRALTGIRDNIKSYLWHHESPKVTAAEKLLANMELYGDKINEMPLQQQTAAVDNMLKDWLEKPDMKEAVTTLGLMDWVQYLQATNETFDQRYVARAKEQSTKMPEAMKKARIEALAAYFKLRDRINALYIMEEEQPPYPTLIAEINALIRKYNDLLERRRRGEKVDITPDTTTPNA